MKAGLSAISGIGCFQLKNSIAQIDCLGRRKLKVSTQVTKSTTTGSNTFGQLDHTAPIFYNIPIALETR